MKTETMLLLGVAGFLGYRAYKAKQMATASTASAVTAATDSPSTDATVSPPTGSAALVATNNTGGSTISADADSPSGAGRYLKDRGRRMDSAWQYGGATLSRGR